MLFCRSLQPGLSVLKGNCAHSFVQRTTDATNNLISLHQLLKAGAFIFSCICNDTCKHAEIGKKHFVNLNILDKPRSLQIRVSNQKKAQISLGFVLRTICIITCPEIACVPWCRCLHSPLSVTCSSTHLTQKFPTCQKTSSVPMSLTSDPHFPICLAAILAYPFSPTHGKKHPIVCLFCCGSAESQVWPAAIKAQPADTTPGKGEQLTWGQVSLWALILPLPWNRRDTQNLNKSCFDLHNGI